MKESIQHLRKQRKMTQEELAEKSGVSLRTIQRIENGESKPRPDTLKRIAAALNIRTVSMKNFPATDPQEVLSKRKKILHLSALSFLIFPFAGILIPGVVWMVFRDKDKNIDKEGIKAVTFQAIWYLVTIIAAVVYYQWMFGQIENASAVSPSIVTDFVTRGAWIIVALLLANLGFIFWSAFGRGLSRR